MALNADETELFNVAVSVLPDWFTNDDRQLEDVAMMAKVFGPVRAQIREWLVTQSQITTAEGATATTPDWLDAIARDRGTRRRVNELSATLRDRLRNIEDAVTRGFLIAAAQSMLDGESVAGSADMTEMPRDGAFFGAWAQNSGTGGVFAGPSSGVMTFTPTVQFAYPPYHQSTQATGDPLAVKVKSGRVKTHRIVISGAANAGNNGTHVSVGLSGNGIRYGNGSGVAGADATVAWALQRLDVNGQVLEGTPFAFSMNTSVNGSFADRIVPGSRRYGFVVTTPLGTSGALRTAILESMRQKKAAGVLASVERRTV